jgi:hypothetical protein
MSFARPYCRSSRVAASFVTPRLACWFLVIPRPMPDPEPMPKPEEPPKPQPVPPQPPQPPLPTPDPGPVVDPPLIDPPVPPVFFG